MRRRSAVFMATLFTLAGCPLKPGGDGGVDGGADLAAPGADLAAPDLALPDLAPTDGGQGGAARFVLGVAYAEKGLAVAHAPLGLRWTKIRPEYAQWGAIEKQPPQGGVHKFDWSCLDSLILEYQKAGFTRIQA
ncbi:MAG: hypothetical protein EXR72_19015 [Myxococcales bacterium]|nr:hypothetical protein [Myxococcales bacterium]